MERKFVDYYISEPNEQGVRRLIIKEDRETLFAVEVETPLPSGWLEEHVAHTLLAAPKYESIVSKPIWREGFSCSYDGVITVSGATKELFELYPKYKYSLKALVNDVVDNENEHSKELTSLCQRFKEMLK